jgi:ParB family transcriptional regulator, chromosome partitioning protein
MSKGLGRGLSALISSNEEEEIEFSTTRNDIEKLNIPISAIIPDPKQPRKIFHEQEINELAQSIKYNGLLQPILVRENPQEEDNYLIIAGERRWRASKIAGLQVVPVIVKILSDKEILEFSIVENIQRSDLSPIEEAYAYKRLVDEYDYSQEEISSSVGKSRSHIANIIRLTNLPVEIQDFVNERKISMGHARALIGVDGNIDIAKLIIAKNLSVRETENLINQQNEKNQNHADKKISRKKQTKNNNNQNDDLSSIALNISNNLGLGVVITDDQVIIDYNNISELDVIIQKLSN